MEKINSNNFELPVIQNTGCCGNNARPDKTIDEIPGCSDSQNIELSIIQNAECCGNTAKQDKTPNDITGCTDSRNTEPDNPELDTEASCNSINMANIPLVTSEITIRDHINAWKVRWGINRKSYKVEPGLYKMGLPDENSHVLVTSNYKLTFDMVRKELSSLNIWILVLDTRGINVWCAAGKGTFGTRELINRISKTNLKEVVKHRKLILPQLGAPGVAAHLVEKFTGFKVKYGPVYARDIKAFLENNLKATNEMRDVKFTLRDRLTLVPMELVPSLKLVPFMIAAALIFSLIESGNINSGIWSDITAFAGTILFGAVIFQLSLPFFPFKSFALNGWLQGFLEVFLLNLLFPLNLMENLVFCLLLPPVISYLSVNFTGATTFTSLSGVNKELKYAVPMMIGSLSLGIITNIFYLLLAK